MNYFLDTSALVKRYRYEIGTETIDEILQDNGSTIIISSISICEVYRAIHRHLRMKRINKEDFEMAIDQFYTELHSQRLEMVESSRDILFHANHLIFSYNISVNDAIILGSAMSVSYRNPIFVCADINSGLLNAAKNCHFSILNPLNII